MIDSIHLRLHNLQRYKHILTYLIDHSDQDIYQETAPTPMAGAEKMFYLRTVEFKTEGKTLLQSNGHKLTSSHYSLGWKLASGDRAGSVDFNFSIPKLIYGTNVIQFVPHKTEFSVFKYFDHLLMDDYKANQKVTHRRLSMFLRSFFKNFTTFGETDIDPNDIEIMRIDICWNQFFNSKHDALEYLSYQKHVKKKHLRITSKNQKSYATSVFFNTRDYGAKIYHKGSEYRSSQGERKHHLKANRQIKALNANGNFIQKGQTRRIPYDVERIAEYADKILRYEITFRRSYLSKIFRRKVFRRKNEAWQLRMQKWKECHRICQYATGKNITLKKEKRAFWFSVFIGRVNMNDEYTRYWVNYHKYNFKHIDLSKGLQKSDKDFYRWWLKKRDQYISFRMAVSDRTTRKNIGEIKTIDIGNGIEHDLPFEARFSPALLRECFKVFNDFRDHFEIKEKLYLSDVQRRLDMYNNNIDTLNKMQDPGSHEKKKALHVGAKRIIKLLENDTWDGLVDKGLVCRKTRYNYEKEFKALNFNLHGGSMVNIWNCRDFQEYHRSLCHEGLEKYLRNNIFH